MISYWPGLEFRPRRGLLTGPNLARRSVSRFKSEAGLSPIFAPLTRLRISVGYCMTKMRSNVSAL